MPKEANLQLVRAERSGCTLGYEVIEKDRGRRCLTSDFWGSLEQFPSFAFYGARGNFTARRETRQRGGTYWTAYKKTDQKLQKAYLGKSSALNLEKLEATAAALANPPPRR
jgi:hypothetical protein